MIAVLTATQDIPLSGCVANTIKYRKGYVLSYLTNLIYYNRCLTLILARHLYFIWKGAESMVTQATQVQITPIRATYKVEEIAEILGIGRSSAYNLVKEGVFKTVRIGTTIRVSKKSFDEWLNNQII